MSHSNKLPLMAVLIGLGIGLLSTSRALAQDAAPSLFNSSANSQWGTPAATNGRFGTPPAVNPQVNAPGANAIPGSPLYMETYTPTGNGGNYAGQGYPGQPYPQMDYGNQTANFGQAGFGQPGYGHAGFGDAGFGQAGFGHANFGQANFGQAYGLPNGQGYNGAVNYGGYQVNGPGYGNGAPYVRGYGWW